MNTIIQRPPFQNVSLADGLRWRPGKDWIFFEKLDGQWCVKEIANSVLIGEKMREGFHAFDIVRISGQAIDREPLRFRLSVLADFIRQHPDVLPVATGNGGEFLEAVLRDGKEGIVAKRLSSPFGATWWKCKRIETHDCTVAEIHPRKASVRLELNGEDCGWLSTAGRKLTVGSVVEIACHSRHASGKFREARILKIRKDKVTA